VLGVGKNAKTPGRRFFKEGECVKMQGSYIS
jgi:hypothetical protein